MNSNREKTVQNINWISMDHLAWPGRLESIGAGWEIKNLKPFYIRDSIGSFPVRKRDGVVKTNGIMEQLEEYASLMDEPGQETITCITSGADDLHARAVALKIMDKFINDVSPLVKWHGLTGGFNDQLAYPKSVKSDVEMMDNDFGVDWKMIVMYGIDQNSTNSKLENMKTIINKHKNVPCIIVAAADNPYKIMARARCHCDYMINIGKTGVDPQYI